MHTYTPLCMGFDKNALVFIHTNMSSLPWKLELSLGNYFSVKLTSKSRVHAYICVHASMCSHIV